MINIIYKIIMPNQSYEDEVKEIKRCLIRKRFLIMILKLHKNNGYIFLKSYSI